MQIEEINQTMMGKIKNYEQANNILNISEKKNKDQF